MKRIPKLEIVGLGPDLIEPLGDLFATIQQSGESSSFHPHPFTHSEAERICNYKGQDQYYALLFNGQVLGYGMLRGWDEGYSIPSLGIYVRPEVRGQGFGELMMSHLHAAAHLRGAVRIRLKVYKDNYVARQMYEKLGYVFTNKEGDQLVGFYKFL